MMLQWTYSVHHLFNIFGITKQDNGFDLSVPCHSYDVLNHADVIDLEFWHHLHFYVFPLTLCVQVHRLTASLLCGMRIKIIVMSENIYTSLLYRKI